MVYFGIMTGIGLRAVFPRHNMFISWLILASSFRNAHIMSISVCSILRQIFVLPHYSPTKLSPSILIRNTVQTWPLNLLQSKVLLYVNTLPPFHDSLLYPTVAGMPHLVFGFGQRNPAAMPSTSPCISIIGDLVENDHQIHRPLIDKLSGVDLYAWTTGGSGHSL